MGESLSSLSPKELAEKTRAYLCLDCSKCTASCPLGRVGTIYSPRSFVQHLVVADEGPGVAALWRCLTCGLCQQRCPSDVDFPDFIRELRRRAIDQGERPHPTHSETIHEIMQILVNPNVKPKRTSWLPDWIPVIESESDQKAEDIYFVGCTPYFEIIFADFDLSLLETHLSALNFLKSCGIVPSILADERCCGHDAFWSGDIELFKKLAGLNVEVLKKVGARRIFVSCPEGYHTLSKIYPEYFEFPFEVVNTVKFLGELLKLKPKDDKSVVITYLDSCRMGRFSGIYDEPRQLLSSLGNVDLVEMEMNRENAPCCGSNLWINCDSVSRKLQMVCLDEAIQTGASILVCPCDKCRIHLACAQLENGKLKDGTKTENILSFLHRRGVSELG